MQNISELIGWIIGLIIVIAWIGAWIATFKQAGYSISYSILWGILMIVPILNIIAFGVFAFREWPIRKELATLRTRCGVAVESDAYLVMQDALRLELQGKTPEALLKYQEIATRFRGTGAGNDAEKSVTALQKTVS
jgi:hypothetical protein